MDFEAINGILNCFWYNFYIHTQVSVPDLKKTINELRIMIILMSGVDCSTIKYYIIHYITVIYFILYTINLNTLILIL
jgi:hypothetical protein